MISASVSAVSGVVSAGLSTTVLPVASAGRELPGRHQQREVPGDDLPGDAERARRRAVARVLELVGPAGVVEEVRGRERDVDVARLADRLAVVERLEHGELAGALLDRARDAEEVLGALAPGQVAPDRLVGRRARRATAASTSAGAGLGDLGQRRRPSRGRSSRTVSPAPGAELAVHEDAVGRAQARASRAPRARGRTRRAGPRPCSVERHVVGAVVAAARELVALQQQVVEQARGAEAEVVGDRASAGRRPRRPSRGSGSPPCSRGCRPRA